MKISIGNKQIIIIILMILVVGSLILFYNQSHDEVYVGEIKFIVPNDYKLDGFNDAGDPTISGGENSIYFTYFNDTNITKIVKDYVDERESNNVTIIQSNFTVNDKQVYKTYSSQGASHYWFIVNGKTYSIFTWKETPNIDNTVNSLISSIK